MEINYDIIRDEFMKYVDMPAFEARMKKLGATSVNPFKLNNVGKPVGFEPTLAQLPGAAIEIGYLLLWAVEKATYDLGQVAKGGEKRKALVQLLDNSIKLGWPLESFDDNIIGWMIDQGVAYLNGQFGNGWIDHIPVPTLAKLPAPVAPPDPPATEDTKETPPEKVDSAEPPTPPAVEDEKEPEPDKSGTKKGKSK